jgi:hypothetical protein
LNGKIKEDGREEAIRYDALTRFVLKGYYTLVSAFGTDTSATRDADHTPNPVIRTDISLGEAEGCGGFPARVERKGGTDVP